MSQAFAQRRAMLGSISAADNIQSMADIAAQHAQTMRRLAAAFQQLYGAIPPDQKKTADEVLRIYDARPKR